MKKTLLTLVALLMLVVPASPAGAVTGNFVEDFEHPFVGLIVFYDEEGEFSHRCSGSLLNEWTFLTAGHCTFDAASARIYFHQDAGADYDPETQIDPTTGYPEFCIPNDPLCIEASTLLHFDFADFAGFPETRDLGLAILDEPATFTSEFGVLAAAGTLDPLATQRGRQDITFTVSGYGVSRINPVMVQSFRERLMAQSQLVNLRSALAGGFNLQTTANPGKGKGGTCFGDSGGPVFYGGFESNLIVGVTSFGLNATCTGTDFAYRVDRQEVLDWIVANAKGDVTIAS